MTPELMTALIGLVGLVGAAFGYWRYFMAQIDTARRDAVLRAEGASALATLAREELASHKLHAAETFATKAGLHEQTTQLLRAIEGVGNRIEGVHERLDRMYENPPRRTTMRAN